MQSVNWSRVFLGGLLAGLVINISEFVLNGVVLKEDWATAMQAMGKQPEFGASQITIFNVIGFLTGLFAVWLYAAMRPRFGPGPKTAIIAAIAIWFIGAFLPNVGFAAMHIFPSKLLLIGTVWSFVETIAALWLGAWIYREETAMRAAAVTT